MLTQKQFLHQVAYSDTVFFAETFRSFLAETFWSRKNFGHLSHSCIKTRPKGVFSLYFQTF